MGWTTPRTWTIGEVTTKTILDAHVRDNLRYLHGDDGAIALSDSCTWSKSQNSQTYLICENTNAGTAAHADIQARNTASTDDAMRMLCMGTAFTTSGGFVQDAGVLCADVNLSGGLSIIARHATGDIRFYTAGSTVERARFNSSGNFGFGTANIDERIHVANSAGAVAIQIENEAAGTTGDCQINFTKAGTDTWCMGLDDSLSDGFSISSGNVLGTTEFLSFSSGGNVVMGNPAASNPYISLQTGATGSGLAVHASFDLLIDQNNDSTTAQFTVSRDTGTTMLVVTEAGLMLLNDSSNAGMTQGLTINQGANDNEILALKSSDVAHGVTDLAETDTYFLIQKVDASAGGASLRAFSETSIALGLVSVATTENTTHNTTGTGNVTIDCYLKSGTGIGAHGADANLLVIRNNASAKFIFDAEGDSFEDGTGWTAYDEHDDLSLLDALDVQLGGANPVRAGFREWIDENAGILERLGLVVRDARSCMVNRSGIQELLVGAVRQLGAKVERQERVLCAAGLLAN